MRDKLLQKGFILKKNALKSELEKTWNDKKNMLKTSMKDQENWR